ncbi:MAG: response regulator transcription factor [Calditrichaeota bacterium]|nr:response regulator transcription factor [Calditrichota bacterium]
MAKKARVLVIDKDPDFLGKVKSALETEGFEVITALTTQQGLDEVQYEQPDCVVMELMMEKHDSGFTFARSIKSNPLYHDVKIFLVSSAKEKTGFEFSQQEDGHWMKTDAYADKPIAAEEVVSRVKKLLDKENK